MLRQRFDNRGFSIAEILISAVLVLIISTFSYRVLKSSTNKQLASISTQKTDGSAQVAFDRFKRDVQLIDNNWIRYGVASVYPHQGYGFENNYYLDSTSADEPNDGVTFLRRDPTADRIYEFNLTILYCNPTPTDPAIGLGLYNQGLPLKSITGINVGDWMLVYQAGHYALGIVQNTGPGAINLREPNSEEKQIVNLNSGGKSTGYVTRPGIVMSDTDFDGNATTGTSDDSYCFEGTSARLQKINSPVSYFVDYRTSDSKEKSGSNTYVLDSEGNKQKMLVRAEYVNGVVSREYITPVESVGFTYDLTGDTSVSGTTGQVIHDVGRDKTSIGLLDLTKPITDTDQFQTTYRIAALRMNLVTSAKDNSESHKFVRHTKDLRVAIDPSYNDDIFRASMTVESSVTDELKRLPPAAGITQETGKPLYFVNGDSEEIIVPVSKFEVGASGEMGSQSAGELYVYDKKGCPANPLTGCDPSVNKSSIKFSIGGNREFFPHTVIQTSLPNGGQRILIGGVGMMNDGTNIERRTMLGTIDLAPGETIAEKLKNPISGQCNIPGCSLQFIDTGPGTFPDFLDTSHIAVDPATPGHIFVTSMTKKGGEGSPAMLYEGVAGHKGADTNYTFTKVGEIPEIPNSRVVTAISDRVMYVKGVRTVAICTSKRISKACGSECMSDDSAPDTAKTGKIMLVSESSTTPGTLDTVALAEHNYKCPSMNVDKNGNLIVFGRLTAQPISQETIRSTLAASLAGSPLTPSMMYLDEIAATDASNSYYADYFQVDPSTYEDPSNPQYIGWMTGASTVEFPDGTFGMVNANKFRLAPGYMGNTASNPVEYSNVGISQLNLGGMQDRVVASIETNQQNLNQSDVVATFTSRSSDLPGIYIPGTFYMNSNPAVAASRTKPTPLPMLPASMSDNAWLIMYQEMMHSHDASGINTKMPILGANQTAVSDCTNSKPSTCH